MTHRSISNKICVGKVSNHRFQCSLCTLQTVRVNMKRKEKKRKEGETEKEEEAAKKIETLTLRNVSSVS